MIFIDGRTPPGANPPQVIEMSVIPQTAAPRRNAAVPAQPSHRSSDPAPHRTAAAPVLITEHQVMFATAVAAAPRPRLVTFWRRLAQSLGVEREPRRHYPPRRASYFERAAISREMERL
jgi:hypothetical protein